MGTVYLKIIAFLLLFVGPFSIARAESLRVLTSTWWIAEWLEAVALDTVEVGAIIPATADPHVYQLKPSDMRRLSQADVVVINGLGLEPWEEDLAKHLTAGQQLFVVCEFFAPDTSVPPLDRDLLIYTDYQHGKHLHREADMHVWLDPVMQWLAFDALAAKLSLSKPGYWKSAEQLDEIDALVRDLDAGISRKLAGVQRELITGHDSFSYFARRYGLTIVGNLIQSCDTHTHDPSPRELVNLGSLVKQRNIDCVFTDTQVNARSLSRFISQHGLEQRKLYSGTLDGDLAAWATAQGLQLEGVLPNYRSMMLYNAATIAR